MVHEIHEGVGFRIFFLDLIDYVTNPRDLGGVRLINIFFAHYR